MDHYHTFKDGKEIVSPYRFRSKQGESAMFVMNHIWHTNYEKVPSLKSVITKMATIATTTDELLKKKEELSLRKDEELSAADEKDEGNKSIPSACATTFLYEGIVLENDQYMNLEDRCTWLIWISRRELLM